MNLQEPMEVMDVASVILNTPSMDIDEVFCNEQLGHSPQKTRYDHCFLTPPLSSEATRPTERPAETPRRHWNNSVSSLPHTFTKKCSVFVDDVELTPIKEQDVLEEKGVKCRVNRITTPKKKVKSFVKVLLKNDAALQEQKENSPIKIEMQTESNLKCANKAVVSCSFTVKQPPIKITPYVFVKTDNSLDILSKLADMSLDHVIKKIFDDLDPIDLTNLEVVSSKYKNMLLNVVPQALGAARKLALTSKENIGARPILVARSRNETTPKKLIRINREIPSPKRRTSLSPQLSPRSRRFHYYIQAGMSLGRSERLEKCPRCTYPAIRSETVATCSSCTYSFCVQCRSIPHPTIECNFFVPSPESPGSRKRRYAIGTKASKKALRRL